MRISDWSSDVCSSDLLAKLVTAYGQVEKKIGDPTDPANLMGPLNSSNAVDAYLDAIEKAKAAGGTVASGGKALTERKGNFVLPTLITGLDNKAEVVQTETFAPILYVMKYSKLEDAIAMQNDVPQGDRKSTTSELQSLMRISYAVLCLKKKKHKNIRNKSR